MVRNVGMADELYKAIILSPLTIMIKFMMP